MLQHFLKNAILIVAINLAVKGTYLLFVEREVQNVLPEGDYGQYFSLLNFAMLFQLVLDFGLQYYNSRNLSGNRTILAKYFPHFLGIKLLLALCFMSSLLLIGWGIGYDRDALLLLTIIGINQFLMSMLLFFRSNLTGLGKYRTDSWVSISDKVLMLFFVGGLLLFRQSYLTVYTFAIAQALSWILSLILVGGLLSQQLERFLPRLDIAIGLTILKKAGPFAIAVFLMTVYTRTDAVMIERLLVDGKQQADHYAAAYRLLDAVNMIGVLLFGLLLPMFARLIAQKEPVLDLLKLGLSTVLVGALALAIAVAIYAVDIVNWLYDFADARTAQILQLLIFSFVAMSINAVYGPLLSAANHLEKMNYVFVFGCVLNIVGNSIVLTSYGAVGVAFMTLLTQSFITLAQAVVAHRCMQLPLAVVPWQRFLLFLLLLVFSAYGLQQLSGVHWLVLFSAQLIAGLLLGFVCNVLNLRDWKALLAS